MCRVSTSFVLARTSKRPEILKDHLSRSINVSNSLLQYLPLFQMFKPAVAEELFSQVAQQRTSDPSCVGRAPEHIEQATHTHGQKEIGSTLCTAKALELPWKRARASTLRKKHLLVHRQATPHPCTHAHMYDCISSYSYALWSICAVVTAACLASSPCYAKLFVHCVTPTYSRCSSLVCQRNTTIHK